MVKASKSTIKYINKQNVLNAFIGKDELTKAEISEQTKLSFATISNLISHLVDEGWILENRIGESNGGRKPIVYSLNGDLYYIITFRITPKGMMVGIVNLKSEIVYSKTIIMPVYDEKSLTKLISAAFEDIYASRKDISDRFCAVAVSCPGIIDNTEGRLLYSSILHLSDINMTELIRRASGSNINVHLFHDTDALLLGEYYLNSDLNGKSLAYILCENGVGFAFFDDGRLFRQKGMGMELGHITMNLSLGSDSNYYSKGGYLGKTLSESPAIRRFFELCDETNSPIDSSLDPTSMDYADIVNLCFHNNPVARQVIKEQISLLGWVVSNVVDLFNPDVVIIGGVLTMLGKELEDSLTASVKERAIGVFTEDLKICNAKYGFNSSLIGMAKHVMTQQIFKSIKL
ncbi:MAG: ROK family transcriptional regulator [Clostridiaceae bacterium]|jgi:predicted NBD/HSP70 family sugar kinase|nr:ROK family transcriptional regulator [Clostridiaceae bacterium]